MAADKVDAALDTDSVDAGIDVITGAGLLTIDIYAAVALPKEAPVDSDKALDSDAAVPIANIEVDANAEIVSAGELLIADDE